MKSLRRLLAFMAWTFFVSGSAHAQGTAEPGLALRGMDVVSYFQAGGPVKGQAAMRHDFDGARYLFSSAQNKAAFVADPDRYLPQFAGLCTSGLSKGFIGDGDPTVWKIVAGKLYLFSTAERMPADAQASETIARANQNWAQRK
ncbi:MAG: YHS domain-containing (seleno)protein [Rubrivivax sp.]|nr:YHS domain-containing (seleno)protein [Rubrivivax sp.]